MTGSQKNYLHRQISSKIYHADKIFTSKCTARSAELYHLREKPKVTTLPCLQLSYYKHIFSDNTWIKAIRKNGRFHEPAPTGNCLKKYHVHNCCYFHSEYARTHLPLASLVFPITFNHTNSSKSRGFYELH